MPRQIDLFPQNLQVSNNPLNQLGMTTGQLTNMISELTNLPALELEAIEQFITQLLTYIDQATGLDLLPFWQAVENSLSSLTTLFGQLNPLSGSFDPVGAIITFLQLVVTYSASLPSTLVSDLSGIWGAVSALPQEIIDAIANALGVSGTGNPVSTVESVLSEIPFGNVVGTLGATNIGEAVGSAVDQLVQAFTSLTGSGFSFGQLANAAAGTANTAANAQTAAQNTSATLANRAVTKPSYLAVDPTADAVFHIASIQGSTPTTVGVSATTSVIGFIATPDAGIKESIIWLGQTTTGITAMFLNVYSVNTSTGVLTLVYSSPNIISSVPNGMAWNYYNLASANYITSAQGNWFAVEMQVTGTGTYQVVGIPNHWLPANPNAYPKQLGATRATQNTPTFDAVGAGNDKNGQTTATTSITWSHTATAGAYVLVSMNTLTNNIADVHTVTYGGTAMTKLGSIGSNNGTAGSISLWGLANVSAGAKTVSASSTATGGQVQAVAGSSASYLNVGSAGTVTTNFGSGTAQSVTATGASSALTVGALGGAGVVQTLGSFSQTQRYVHNSVSATDASIVIGDSAATGSVSFADTASAASWWGGVSVQLLGSSVSAPSTISSPTYAANVPWFGLGGSAGVTQFPPATTEYSTAGTYTYTAPTWANHVDVIPLGPGGGGGGGAFGAGSPGGTTTVTVGGTTITATGGSAGAGGTTSSAGAIGASPGNLTYLGTTYYGGSAVYLTPGSTPGGGGSGATWSGLWGHGAGAGNWGTAQTFSTVGLTTISVTVGAGGPGEPVNTPGYDGADGAVWIVARQ